MAYLSSFFLNELENLKVHQDHLVSKLCLSYLSELMEAGSQKEFLFLGGQKKYLVDLYQNAVTASGKQQQAENFRHLADYSLLISGVFADSIHEIVGIEYYISMGQSAYSSAAKILNNKLFLELSQRYLSCMILLREASNMDRDLDPEKLYKFWLLTKSPYSRERLVKIGIIPETIFE